MKKLSLYLFILLSVHQLSYAASAKPNPALAPKILEALDKAELFKFQDTTPSENPTTEQSNPSATMIFFPTTKLADQQDEPLIDYMRRSVAQGTFKVHIFNDRGTYYSGAAKASGLLPKAKDDSKIIKYMFDTETLLTQPAELTQAPATQVAQAPQSTARTKSSQPTQAPQATENPGMALLRLLQPEPATQQQQQPTGSSVHPAPATLFAQALRPTQPATTHQNPMPQPMPSFMPPMPQKPMAQFVRPPMPQQPMGQFFRPPMPPQPMGQFVRPPMPPFVYRPPEREINQLLQYQLTMQKQILYLQGLIAQQQQNQMQPEQQQAIRQLTEQLQSLQATQQDLVAQIASLPKVEVEQNQAASAAVEQTAQFNSTEPTAAHEPSHQPLMGQELLEQLVEEGASDKTLKAMGFSETAIAKAREDKAVREAWQDYMIEQAEQKEGKLRQQKSQDTRIEKQVQRSRRRNASQKKQTTEEQPQQKDTKKKINQEEITTQQKASAAAKAKREEDARQKTQAAKAKREEDAQEQATENLTEATSSKVLEEILGELVEQLTREKLQQKIAEKSTEVTGAEPLQRTKQQKNKGSKKKKERKKDAVPSTEDTEEKATEVTAIDPLHSLSAQQKNELKPLLERKIYTKEQVGILKSFMNNETLERDVRILAAQALLAGKISNMRKDPKVDQFFNTALKSAALLCPKVKDTQEKFEVKNDGDQPMIFLPDPFENAPQASLPSAAAAAVSTADILSDIEEKLFKGENITQQIQRVKELLASKSISQEDKNNLKISLVRSSLSSNNTTTEAQRNEVFAYVGTEIRKGDIVYRFILECHDAIKRLDDAFNKKYDPCILETPDQIRQFIEDSQALLKADKCSLLPRDKVNFLNTNMEKARELLKRKEAKK